MSRLDEIRARLSTGTGGPMRSRPYSNHELAYRPIEHQLEALTCRELARILGVGHTQAAKLKRGVIPLPPGSEDRIYHALREGSV